MTKQPVTLTYATEVCYGAYSSTLSGGATFGEAMRALQRDMRFYTLECGHALKSAKIYSRCPKCYGEGTVIKKSRKNKIFGVKAICPDCKGMPEGRDITVYDALAILDQEVTQ